MNINPDEIKLEISQLTPEIEQAMAQARAEIDAHQDEFRNSAVLGEEQIQKAMKEFEKAQQEWNCNTDSKK